MPPMCWKNLLEVPAVPNCIQVLNHLERQLLRKNLYFIKIRDLPSSRMQSINDRVINVMIPDDDISKSVSILPRMIQNSGVIHVRLKRQLSMKNWHEMGLIRPDLMFLALKYLIENNIHYKNVKLMKYEDWMTNFSEDSENMDINETILDQEPKIEECKDMALGEAEENEFNDITCMMPREPEENVVSNDTEKNKSVVKKRGGKIFNIAPGEKKVPSNWVRDKDFDSVTFFELYPTGIGGMFQKRSISLNKFDFVSTRFLSRDRRYSKNADYVFVCQQLLERHLVESNINIKAQRGTTIKEADGSTTISNSNPFDIFKKIPGTPSYWQNVRNELFAKMNQFGPFSFFITLSANEKNWEQVNASILHFEESEGLIKVVYENGWELNPDKIKFIFSDKEVSAKEFTPRNGHKFYKDNFMLITRLFDSRVKAFISKILCANTKINHYSYRIEFQVRGMPHLHGVFWLDQSLIDQYQNDGEYSEDVVELIDEWVSCSTNTDDPELNELVRKYNCHNHTKSCRRGRTICRFSFPRLPSARTIVAKPLEEDEFGSFEEYDEARKKYHNILIKAKEILESLTKEDVIQMKDDLKTFLEKIPISLEEYEKALSYSSKGKAIVLKRRLSERWVNNYNAHYLLAWRANMDIQFCLDSYAVITYITDYVTKADAGLTIELKKALLETKYCSNFEQLNHLKMTYFKHKQVSVAEATYRLINGMFLSKSNVACTFVSADFPWKRHNQFVKVGKKNAEESLDHDEEEEEMNNQDIFNITGKVGKFKGQHSLHEKYAERPEALSDVCLAQFATSYHSIAKKSIPKDVEWKKDSSIEKGLLKQYGSEISMPKYILLTSGKYMQIKTRPIVLRVHASQKKQGPHEIIYSELVLFLPWKNEVEELKPHNRLECEKCFQDNFDIIKRNKKSIYPHSEMVDTIREILESGEDSRPTHLADTMGQQANMDDKEMLDPCDLTELPPEGQDSNCNLLPDCPYKPVPVESKELLIEQANSLSPSQRVAFDKVITFAKSIRRCSSNRSTIVPPPQLIVHGGGGVGKSYLIHTISKWVDLILRKKDDNPDMPKTLLLAYTGSAASIIGGTTLHTGLGFNYGNDILALGSTKREVTRKFLDDVEVVIVDEMSLVSSDNLYNIDKRLKTIFSSEDTFGGRAMLLVGDIMQLPPVRAVPIYKGPSAFDSYALFTSKELNLWENMESILLSTNFRHGQGLWQKLLNRARVGACTKEDIDILQSRPSSKLTRHEYNQAIHVFYQNKEVDNHNLQLLEYLESELVEIPADLFPPKGYKPKTGKYGQVDGTQLPMNLKVIKTFQGETNRTTEKTESFQILQKTKIRFSYHSEGH